MSLLRHLKVRGKGDRMGKRAVVKTNPMAQGAPPLPGSLPEFALKKLQSLQVMRQVQHKVSEFSLQAPIGPRRPQGSSRQHPPVS